MSTRKTSSESSERQSRGSELRSKIIDSQVKGEDYRSSHQGTDTRSADLDKTKNKAASKIPF